MIKIKNLSYRILLYFSCIGLVLSMYNCASDDNDPDPVVVQTFLEKYDGSKWKGTDEDVLIYLRLNNNMNKAVEMWLIEVDLAKGLADDDCYYYTDDLLDMTETEVVENSANKFVFTYLGNETWTFSMEGERLKLDFETLNNVREPVYLTKTTVNVDAFVICS